VSNFEQLARGILDRELLLGCYYVEGDDAGDDMVLS
jgi:hypothetical protein